MFPLRSLLKFILVSDANAAVYTAGTSCLIEFYNKKAADTFYYERLVLRG